MQTAVRILTGTPLWVFAVLGYLVWQGIQSLRSRTLPIWRLLIVPTLFIVSGLSRIILDPAADVWSLLPWILAMLLFLPLPLATGPRLLAVNRETGQVTRPGSPIPLVRNVVVFGLQYAAAIMAALQLSNHSAAAIISHVVSGATAGYFIGWAMVLLLHYKRAETIQA